MKLNVAYDAHRDLKDLKKSFYELMAMPDWRLTVIHFLSNHTNGIVAKSNLE